MSNFADKLLLGSVPWLAAGIINVLYRFLQPETIGAERIMHLWAVGQPVILSFWHDQLLLMPKGYCGQGARTLISSSRDGELIARTVALFNIGSVRGSSSRGGQGALKTMVDLSSGPHDLVFTPDGPKGPRHGLKGGIAQLARISGRPVVPTAFACSSGHRFRSWDRFLLPYPWGKAVYIYGEPLVYGKHETLDEFLSRLQTAMDATNRKAGDYLRQYGFSAV